MLRAAAE